MVMEVVSGAGGLFFFLPFPCLEKFMIKALERKVGFK